MRLWVAVTMIHSIEISAETIKLFLKITSVNILLARHTGLCWKSLNEHRSDILLRTPTHGRVCVSLPARTYLKLLCADIDCGLEDLLGVMDGRDGRGERERERERVRKIRPSSVIWWWWYITPTSQKVRDIRLIFKFIKARLNSDRATSRILTELLYVCSSWSCFCSAICEGP